MPRFTGEVCEEPEEIRDMVCFGDDEDDEDRLLRLKIMVAIAYGSVSCVCYYY